MMKFLDSKTIFQIKFRPTLKHMGGMFDIAATLEGSFEHWEVEGSHKCTLFDREKKGSVIVSPDSITFVTKKAGSQTELIAEMAKLVSLFSGDNQVEKVSRIGFRCLSIKSFRGDYKKYVNDYYGKFYGSQDELKSILADSIDDVITVLETTKDGYHVRTRIGPLKDQSELRQYFGVEKFDEGNPYPELSKGEVGLLIDSDVYVLLETGITDAIKRFESLVSLCHSMQEDIWKLLEKSKK